jgi:4-diphosphocytidyl-2-C-methyl-D-erythritol kinase
MKTIKVKTPAKINLTLEILNKREDGYHNIQSIMQAVNLYDILTITVDDIQEENIIEISGNNPLIPYDSSNLAYKSVDRYLNRAGITNKKIDICIEKHIPVAAGLAGGSSNAAGVLFGLNMIFDDLLEMSVLDELAAQMGSDINFCLHGGTQLTTSRGEILQKIPTPAMNIIIVKPDDLCISTKEAYTKFSELEYKPEARNPDVMINAIKENNIEKIALLLNNHLEEAVLDNYPQVLDAKDKLIAKGCLNAVMSGSGPSVFGIYTEQIDFSELKKVYKDVFEVTAVDKGVSPEKF